MLQQTTVAAVIPYFERFLAQFPTVMALAAADEQDVLCLWEGLGYYSRARNIHKTARIVAEELGGQFPKDVDALQELPGIGRYTAGAIASFAFDSRAPIVEANTLRLYCRLTNDAGDPRSTAGQKRLWQFASDILPRKNVGDFNQALMELGGTLCGPKNPSCDDCPVKTCCGAAQSGTQHSVPRPKVRPKITAVTEASIAVRHRGRILLRQYAEGERWAGLWDFVRFELSRSAAKSSGIRLRSYLEQGVSDSAGISVEVGESITKMRHSVTRFRIRLLCYPATLVNGTPDAEQQFKWVLLRDLADYPLSVTGRKLANLLLSESR